MAANTFGTYRVRSRAWAMRCTSGMSLSKGLGKFAGGKVITLNVMAKKGALDGQKSREMSLRFNLTGIELNAELGADLLESTVGISMAYTKPDIMNSVPVYLNEKYPADMKTYDFLGPCAIVTYSAGEITLGKDGLTKYAGRTFLLLNMGAVVADRSPDWLTKVVDSTAGKSTLGGCFMSFNKQGSPFNHARGAIRLETTDFSPAAKAKAGGVGLFAGTVQLNEFK